MPRNRFRGIYILALYLNLSVFRYVVVVGLFRPVAEERAVAFVAEAAAVVLVVAAVVAAVALAVAFVAVAAGKAAFAVEAVVVAEAAFEVLAEPGTDADSADLQAAFEAEAAGRCYDPAVSVVPVAFEVVSEVEPAFVVQTAFMVPPVAAFVVDPLAAFDPAVSLAEDYRESCNQVEHCAVVFPA